jgi:hypothetical protein
MGRAGRERAAAGFSINEEAERINEIYARLWSGG